MLFRSYNWGMDQEILNLFNTLNKGNYSDKESLQKIVNFVFIYIRYQPDFESWGVSEKWQLPETTWKLKTGDCEDFAILTMYLFYKYTGIKGEILILKNENSNHAVFGVIVENEYLYADQWGMSYNFIKFSNDNYIIHETISYGQALFKAMIQSM